MSNGLRTANNKRRVAGCGIKSQLGLLPTRRLLPAVLYAVFSVLPITLPAQDAAFVPPLPDGVRTNTAVDTPQKEPPTAVNPAALADGTSRYQVHSKDPILGERIAKISATLEKLPQEQQQFWREFDVTPYTSRKFAGTVVQNPAQTITDWILRQIGTQPWHLAPFSILNADTNRLCVYHTKEVQLVVADIVDRFVCQETATDSCNLRVVTLSRPDWRSKGHASLKPIPIAASGVQGWIVEKQAAAVLIQELAKRLDFRELVPLQSGIQNGAPHFFSAKRQVNYLRDVQSNPTAVNGISEDKTVIEEGFALTFVPLSFLDGQSTAASVKLDIVQVEKMLSTFVDIPTATNPRMRVSIETPQLSTFKLDELIRFPKKRVLLLDLGSVPLPNTIDTETNNVFSGIAKGINPAKRGNVLIFIESN